jgi:hypothetical protein
VTAQTTETGTGLQGLLVKTTTALATEKQASKTAHAVGPYKQENRTNIKPKLFSKTVWSNLTNLHVFKCFTMNRLFFLRRLFNDAVNNDTIERRIIMTDESERIGKKARMT